MEVLLIAVMMGLGIAYFAMQNAMNIPLTLGWYHFTNIPLFFIVIGALLVGLFAAWIMNLVSSIGNLVTFRKQNSRIREDDHVIRDLKNKIHDLEIENTKLRGNRAVTAPRQETPSYRPSFFQRLRHTV